MNQQSILTAFSSRSMAASIRLAKRRVVYAAPGIHPQPAEAFAELAKHLPLSSITISLDFDEQQFQGKLDASMKLVVDYYLPLVKANPPDVLLGGMLAPTANESAIRSWIEEILCKVFPSAQELTQNMLLEERYKDVTFETLNRPDFLDSVRQAFPRMDWEKAYNEFKAAGES